MYGQTEEESFQYNGTVNLLRYFPPGSPTAPTTFGFALPYEFDTLSFRLPTAGDDVLLSGAPQCTKESGCTQFVGILGDGTGQPTPYAQVRNTYTATLKTAQMTAKTAQFTFGKPDDSGFPSVVKFAQYDLSGVPTFEARYDLVRVTDSDLKDPRTLIPKDAVTHLQKGNVAYGGPYSRDETDIWNKYGTQAGLREQSETKPPTHAPQIGTWIVIGLILTVAIVSVVRLTDSKRK